MAEWDLMTPLRGSDALGLLVGHVLSEHPQNESDWLEWKSALDLSRADGQFALAKHLLGFSNRMPSRARAHMGGLAYVVVGAEPGTLHGLTPIDPAVLHDRLRPHIGSDGPEWSPTWVLFESKNVLVAVVESPSEGDPIRCLRRTFGSFPDGSVFVRRPGMTERANSEDMRQLVERAKQSRKFGVDIAVRTLGNPVARSFSIGPDVENFITSERERLMSPLKNEKDPVVRVRRVVREARRVALYREQVDRYLQECRERFPIASVLSQMRNGTAVFGLAIENQSDRNLLSLEVRVRFPSYSKVFDAVPNESPLPKPPPLWGEAFIFQDELDRLRRVFGSPPKFDPQQMPQVSVSTQSPSDVKSRRVDERDASVLVLWAQNLRPHGCVDFMRIPCAVASNASTPLIVNWTATATDANGLAEGILGIDLGEPVPAGIILRAL